MTQPPSLASAPALSYTDVTSRSKQAPPAETSFPCAQNSPPTKGSSASSDSESSSTHSFDVDAWVADQLQSQGQERQDVQQTLAYMREALAARLDAVQARLHSLINDRYTDFLGLSNSVVGIHEQELEIRSAHLEGLRAHIEDAQSKWKGKLADFESKLKYRQQIRDKKRVLEMFLDISKLLANVEGLLRDCGDGNGRDAPTRIKLLERAVGDCNRIRYLVGKGQGYPIIDHIMRVRADKLEVLLHESLVSFLKDWIERYLASEGSAEFDQLEQCLRAFSIIDQTERAELLLRANLVDPAIAKILASKQGKDGSINTGISIDPAVLQDILDAIRNFVAVHGTNLLRYLELSTTLTASEGYGGIGARVFWKPIATSLMSQHPNLFVPGIPDRFQLNYTRCIEFINHIESVICFSETSSEAFRSEPSFVEFIRKWQLAAYFSIRQRTVVQSVESTLASAAGHGNVATLLPSSMPQSEGAAAVKTARRSAGTSAARRPFDVRSAKDGFLTIEATVIYRAMSWCWDDSIFIGQLASRFWRLFVQLALRYSQYLVDHPAPVAEDGAAATTTSSDSAAAEGVRQMAVRLHDVGLFVTKCRDLFDTMVRPKLSELYWQHDQSSIFTRSREEGPPTSEGPNGDCNNKQRSLVSGNGDFSVLSDMLLSTLTTSVLHPLVHDHLSRLVERIAQSLATRCFEDGDKTNVTKSVRQVPSLYRHTNRPPPAGPLPYVDQILAPLSEFVQDESNRMMLSDIAIDIDNNRIAMRAVELRACELATAKYQELIRDLLKGVAKTEASLQRFKRFTTRGGKDSGNVSSEVSAEVVDLRGTIPSTDDNKIRRQVWFDAMAFISNVKQQLGVGHGDTQTAAIADQFLRPLSQLIEPFGQ